MPRTAVLLATYNGEKYLPEMLRSLEMQSFQDFVCCIHDDGSTDGTRSIILDYVMRSPQQFVILDYPPTGSAKGNFLSLLAQVDADYYLYADQDDVWLPEKMNVLINEMIQLENEEFFVREQDKARRRDNSLTLADPTKTPLLVYSDMVVVDRNLKIISESFHRYIRRDPYRTKYQQILIDNPAAGCSMLFNAALRQKVLQYTYIDEIEMHDAWTILCASVFGAIRYCQTPLVCYRQHDNNEMGASEYESAGQKTGRNLRELVSGKFLQNKRDFHERMRLMAHQLLQVKGLSSDLRMTLQEFVDLPRHGKSYRMAFYRKNGFQREHNDLWFRLTC